MNENVDIKIVTNAEYLISYFPNVYRVYSHWIKNGICFIENAYTLMQFLCEHDYWVSTCYDTDAIKSALALFEKNLINNK